MTAYGTGAKAGALAGLISGIILGILLYTVSQAFVSTIRTVIQNSVSANTTRLISVNQLVNLVLILIPIVTIVGGLIGGLILGLIFAAVHDKYMKSQSLPIRGPCLRHNSLPHRCGPELGVAVLRNVIRRGELGNYARFQSDLRLPFGFFLHEVCHSDATAQKLFYALTASTFAVLKNFCVTH
jgi:hypothetical protein